MVPMADEHSPSSITLSPLRATAMVGFGSVVTLALSIVAGKAYALLIGPAGVGLLALMQSIIIIGVMVASAGLATSAVRVVGAASQAGGSVVRAVERSASATGLVGGVAGALVLIAIRDPLAQLVLGSPSRSWMMVVLAVALFLAAAASVQVALLTGLHRVPDVVAVNVATSVAAAALGITLVSVFGEDGLAPALFATAVVQFAGARGLVVRAMKSHAPTSKPAVTRGQMGQLIGAGLPIAAGQLAGSGALFAVPVVVLQVLDTEGVGYYRAAAAISIGYLTFFLAALTQDYYPRLARTTDRVGLGVLVERRMRLVMGMAVPVIIGLLASGPWLVEILYTEEFRPAYDVLQWQLVGDLIRLPAWVFMFVLLAQGHSARYVGVELIGGATLLAGTLVGLIGLGLAGSGAGYAASQLIYYGAAWWMVRAHIGTTPGRLQVAVLLVAAAATIVLLSPVPIMAKSLAFSAAAVLFAVTAWPRVYRLHRSGEL